MCLYLYIINYTLTFYFPCIIKLKVSLGREKCIEHCRGCRSGDMAWPGRGGARRGQWGKFGVAQAAVQIFIFTPDSAVTPTNMTEWRVESTLLGIRLVSTQLLSPAPLPCPRLASPRPPARQTPDCSKQRVWTLGVCCPAQLACFATIKTVSQQD